MNRLQFIRKSLLAITGVAVVTSIPLSDFIQKASSPLPQKKIFYFKVSQELLSDKEAFEHGLKWIEKERGKFDKMEIGYDADDFVKNIITVRITLV